MGRDNRFYTISEGEKEEETLASQVRPAEHCTNCTQCLYEYKCLIIQCTFLILLLFNMDTQLLLYYTVVVAQNF